ncbi:hypothetical protein OROHE_016046 [Orobanche hederae]
MADQTYNFNSDCAEQWRHPLELLPSWMSDFAISDPQPPTPGMHQQPRRRRQPPPSPAVDFSDPSSLSFFCSRPEPAQLPVHDYLLPHLLVQSPAIGEYKMIGSLALKTRQPCMKDREDDGTCGVCLDDLLIINTSNIGGMKIGVLDNCRHEFHVACLEKWLIKKNMCPLCRAVAVNNDDYDDDDERFM